MRDELTDAQVAGVVRAINDGEVEAGELARTAAVNQSVREYAEQMIGEHTAANQRLAELSQRLGIVPAESDVMQKIQMEHRKNMEELREKTGSEFDRAYMDAMVEEHQQALQAIDEKLIPNAKNAELVAMLRDLRPAIAAHLETAKQLREQVGAAG